MTAQLHNIADYRPHYADASVCFSCWHKWVAVAPAGTMILECPACHKMNGIPALYLDAWFQIWRGVAMMMAIPLALFIRGQR